MRVATAGDPPSLEQTGVHPSAPRAATDKAHALALSGQAFKSLRLLSSQEDPRATAQLLMTKLLVERRYLLLLPLLLSV